MSRVTKRKQIAAAKKTYEEEGAIEIDSNAKISRAEGNPDKGAYVEAWVWVYDEDARKEK